MYTNMQSWKPTDSKVAYCKGKGDVRIACILAIQVNHQRIVAGSFQGLVKTRTPWLGLRFCVYRASGYMYSVAL